MAPSNHRQTAVTIKLIRFVRNIVDCLNDAACGIALVASAVIGGHRTVGVVAPALLSIVRVRTRYRLIVAPETIRLLQLRINPTWVQGSAC